MGKATILFCDWKTVVEKYFCGQGKEICFFWFAIPDDLLYLQPQTAG